MAISTLLQTMIPAAIGALATYAHALISPMVCVCHAVQKAMAD